MSLLDVSERYRKVIRFFASAKVKRDVDINKNMASFHGRKK